MAAAVLVLSAAACISPPSSDREKAAGEPPATETEGQRGLPEVVPPAYETVTVDELTVQTFREKALFPIGSATMTPEGEANLQTLVPELPPSGPIQVHGYTDGLGPTSVNFDLSQQRAEAVVNWLFAHGIERSRLEATAHGEDGAQDNVDDPDKRRVEIIYETEVAG
jgi:outer membrane protein OmpA-like peptidoglycan-associated protein